MWSPQKQLTTVETRLFLLLFAEIHGYHSPRELWWSEFACSCSNRVGFYNFFSLWSPEPNDYCWDKAVSVVCRDPWLPHSPRELWWSEFTRSCSNCVGFCNIVSLWTPETIDNCLDAAVSVVCRDPWLPHSPWGIMMVRTHTLLLQPRWFL
jgi:hypothetical protein